MKYFISAILMISTATCFAGGPASTHFIGQKYGGGVIYFVSADGVHGLIAETTDQSVSSTWFDAIDKIKDLNNHSTDGKNFGDWRLPTKDELTELYKHRNLVGTFADSGYWSSSEGVNFGTASCLDFYSGGNYDTEKYGAMNVRAVRSF